MRIVETSDGTVKVVELDPAKWYWIVVDRDAMSSDAVSRIRKRDGMILLKNQGSEITFVENPERLANVAEP